MPIYEANGKRYNLPDYVVSEFVKDFPGARLVEESKKEEPKVEQPQVKEAKAVQDDFSRAGVELGHIPFSGVDADAFAERLKQSREAAPSVAFGMGDKKLPFTYESPADKNAKESLGRMKMRVEAEKYIADMTGMPRSEINVEDYVDGGRYAQRLKDIEAIVEHMGVSNFSEAKEKFISATGVVPGAGGGDEVEQLKAYLTAKRTPAGERVYDLESGSEAVSYKPREKELSKLLPKEDMAQRGYGGYSVREIETGRAPMFAETLYNRDKADQAADELLMNAGNDVAAMIGDIRSRWLADGEVIAYNLGGQELTTTYDKKTGEYLDNRSFVEKGIANLNSLIAGVGPEDWSTRPEDQMILTARDLLAEAAQMREAATGDKGLVGGISDAIGDWNPVKSLDVITDAVYLKNLDNKIKKGEPLKMEEQILLDALKANIAVRDSYGKRVSGSYEVGKIVGDMIPYAVEMMLNPLSGTGKAAGKAAVKKMSKEFAESFGGKAVKRTAELLGSTLGGGAMALTSGLPKTIGGTISRMTGTPISSDNEYGVDFVGAEDNYSTAFFKELGANTLEYASEQFGASVASALTKPVTKYIGKAASKVVSKIPGGTRLLNGITHLVDETEMGKMLSDFMARGNYHGVTEEFFEEVYNALANAATVGDTDLDEFFSTDNIVKTAAAVAIPGVAVHIVNGGANAVEIHNRRKAAKARIERAESAGVGIYGEKWWDSAVRKNLTSDNLETVKKEMTNILNSDLSGEQKNAMIVYAVSNMEMRTLDGLQKIVSSSASGEAAYAAYQDMVTAEAEALKRLKNTEHMDVGNLDEWLNGINLAAVPWNSEESYRAVREYVYAKRAFDNSRDAFKVTQQEMYEQSDEAIDSNSNNNMVYSTTYNGEEVFITGGNVVLNEDGTIDVNNSSESFFIKFPDGHKEPISANMLAGKITVQNAEELKTAGKEAIDARMKAEFDTAEAQAIEQEKRAKGVVFDMTDPKGTHRVEIVSEGEEMSEILLDGAQMEIPTGELNRWKQEAGIQTESGEVKGENGNVQTESAVADNTTDNGAPTGDNVAPVAPKTALELIPRNEKNVPLYEQVDSELAWDGVVEEAGGNEETAMVAINSMIEDKKRALAAAEKAKAKAGATITEKIAAENERMANIEKAKADLAKWQEIAGVKAKRALAAENVAQSVAETAPVVESAPIAETPQATNEMQEADLTEDFKTEDVNQSENNLEVGDQVAEDDAPGQSGVDPRNMSYDERAKRGDMLRNAPAVDVNEGVITSTKELSARKAAEKWWDENVAEPAFYDTEIGEVEISRNSVESSLAHRYGQAKLDALTSLIEGFENAVYLGSMTDGTRHGGVMNHYFAYPINYKGERCYVFCRAMHDANKNRLYVHEVFIADRIKKGDTLQTAASQLHGGIALYKDILANVLDLEPTSASEDRNSVSNSQENAQKSGEIAENVGERMYSQEELAETKEQLGELNATSAPNFAVRLFSIRPWGTLEEANAALKELLASYGETLNGQTAAVLPFLDEAQRLISENSKNQEPRSVEEDLDNGDKRIISYNSRGEVATVAIERDGKIVSVDSYDEGVLFEHTEYDTNGKAASVTRYDKQGNVVGTQVYEDGKAKTPMQKLADRKLDRTEEKRRIPLRERARELEAQVGVKANIIESLDEVKNSEARKRIAAGEAVAGWYSGGQVYLYMPNIKDRREIELTYVHEVVAHHGVKKLLGERFNEFLDGVWNMMSEADRARMLAYVGANETPTLQDMRAAADEYVAELAEKMNLNELEQSTWDKIVDWFKKILENIGFENLTKEDIESMLKASYANLAKGENGNAEIKDRTMFRKKDSERRQEKRRINDAIDTAAGFITVGGKKQATKNRLKKEAERKELAKEIYSSVLKGDFNDVTLSQIDKFIEDATPANPFGRRISQRLPQRMERALRTHERTNAVDALFSRICESAVPANERFSEAGRREIEERKKELLKGWAIATGNWHTDLKEFTDDTEPIGEGKDSKVYMSKDGNSVIKASKGKPFGKKFRPDIDNIPLFNDVFKNSRYEILGYGEIDGQFVRILKQDFIDFAESTPLTPEERKEYMGKLGFKPLNKDYTAFSNGEIVIADLQKSNIVRDVEGDIRVIDADAKLHTKDVGGDYTYPPVETDLPEGIDLGGTMFRKVTPEMDAEYMAAVENGDMETAERLVKEAAKLAMPDTKVVDEDGYPMVVYHGSEEDFNVFDKTKGRANMDIQGMFFSPWDDDARGYGSNVRAFYLNITKPANESTGYKALNKFQGQNGAGIKAREYLVSAGYDGVNNEDQEFVAFDPNQIKSAEVVTYDDNGNVIPLSERFNEEKEDIRFRIANENQDIFVSNAQRAVEGIQQNKATAEQWIAMLKKNGGLKAGEEAWLGLEEWLNEKQGAVTKQEILDFIGANKIQIEEVNYTQFGYGLMDEATRKLEAELKEIGWDAMVEKYPGFDELFEVYDGELLWSEEKASVGEYEDFIIDNKIVDLDSQSNAINETREKYTTEGLERKREIALVVPTIESWNASDEIHFGDAGNGRAVAWVRFGETTDSEGNRVLVIDEIQSKRHQDGREKGYKNPNAEAELEKAEDAYREAIKAEKAYNAELKEKYGYDSFEGSLFQRTEQFINSLTEEEKAKRNELKREKEELAAAYDNVLKSVNGKGVPAAPFEKNWHELAMKRMLRLAAEEGFDKVAWTTGEQQAERYNLGNVIKKISVFPDSEFGGRQVMLRERNNDIIDLDVDNNGVIENGQFKGMQLSEVVGKELAVKILGTTTNEEYESDDLRIGGEGMKGFYDRMLPSFVQKYTKKWGAKVGEVTMPNLSENNTMHSVDVTPEMQESVMEGQTMFRKINKEAEEFNKSHKGGARVVNIDPSNMETELAEEGFSTEDIQYFKERVEKGAQAFYDSERDLIYLFDPTVSKEDLMPILWHEDTHKAISDLDIDQDLLNEFYALINKDRKKSFETIAERGGYEKEEYPEECVACCIQGLSTHGRWNARALARITKATVEDADRQFEIIQPLIDYIKYGRETEENVRRESLDRADVASKMYDTESAKFEKEAEEGAAETTRGFGQEGETRFRTVKLSPEEKERQDKLKENAKAIRRLHNVKSNYPITALRNLGFALETQEQREEHDRLFAERDAISGRQNAVSAEVNPQSMTLMERITESLMKAAVQNKENVDMRMSAIRAYGRDLSNVLKLMRAQRGYDRNTVRMFTNLVKMYLRNNSMSGMSSYDITRLLGLIERANGGYGPQVMRAAEQIAEIITKSHTRELENIVRKQIKTGAEKVNASGVVVQGGVDIVGKRVLNTFRDAINMTTEEEFNKAYKEAFERAAKFPNDEEAKAACDAMVIAKEYRDNIAEAKQQEKELLKSIGKYSDIRSRYDEGEVTRKEYNEYVDSVRKSLIELRSSMIDDYQRVIHALGGDISEGIKRAKEFREREIERIDKIHRMAEADMGDISKSAERKKRGFIGKTTDYIAFKNPIVKIVTSGQGTYNEYMKFFGRNAIGGKGRLYDYFMRRYTEVQNQEWVEKQKDIKKIDDECKKIFGKGYKAVMHDSARNSGVVLEYWNGGEKVTRELSVGQLMYIYMAAKQTDGEMKLRGMGITEEAVNNAVQKLPATYKAFADWVQSDFLPEMRPRLNEVHKRMFGASMSEVKNYFPLVVNKDARQGEVDLNSVMPITPSTITGSIIKRKVNATPLNLESNAFDVLLNHVSDMEHWAAFAEFTRDNNTLIGNKDFMNRVKNSKDLRYGTGEAIWDDFVETARITTGNYRAKSDELTDFMKGVSSAKITFGYYTALKQFLSEPGMWGDAALVSIVKATVNPMGSWKWAKENLPGFAERWEGRTAGNERLADSDNDWSVWDNKVVKAARELGMTPNAFVDAVVVATGARAVYDSRKRFYKAIGLTEAEQHKRAQADAAAAYNETQQSAQGAYLSVLQKEGGFKAMVLTLYRNSQMAYARKVTGSMAELYKKAVRWKDILDAEEEKYIEMGLSKEDAHKVANKELLKSGGKDIVTLVMFGYILKMIYYLGEQLPYLLFGDDDEEKKEIFKTALKVGASGMFEGFSLGNIANDLYVKGVTGNKYSTDMLTTPFISDLEKTITRFANDGVLAGMSQLLIIGAETMTGISPQRLIDDASALIDFADGNLDKATEAQILAMRLLKVPQSQVDKIYIEKALGGDVLEIAERYAEYKRLRDYPLNTLIGGNNKEIKEKYVKRFNKAYNEDLLEIVKDENSYSGYYENASPEEKIKLASIRKKYLEDLTGEEAQEEELTTKELVYSLVWGKKKQNLVYSRLTTPDDVDDDIAIKIELKKHEDIYNKGKDLMGEEWRNFKKANGKEYYLYKDLKKIERAISEEKTYMEKHPEKADKSMEYIRKKRAEAIKLINEYYNE